MLRQLNLASRLPAAIALLLCAVGFAFAQPVSPMKFNLAGQPAPRSAPAETEALGEFRISLDSQLLAPRVEQTVAERFQLPEASSQPFTGELVLRSSSLAEEDSSAFEIPLRRIRESHRIDAEEFDTTLTLTTGYAQPREDSPRISGVRRIGRLSLYGEIDQATAVKNPLRTSSIRPQATPVIRANRVAPSIAKAGQAQLVRPIDAHAANDDVSALALRNYYLEAIYSFMPSLQGKVSYKRSEIETFDPNENVQVEGIVQAGQDVIIKAGYRNETSPSEMKDRKPSSDQKVWTEFILKF